MSKLAAIAALGFSLSQTLVAADTRTIYIVGVSVGKVFEPPSTLDPKYFDLELQSDLMFFNNGAAVAHVERVAGYGVDGPLELDRYDKGPFSMQPGQTAFMHGVDYGVQLEIGKYQASGEVVTNATLELVHGGLVGCGPFTELNSARQGRIPLPVFEDLFPAGTLVVSGDVVPFNPGPAYYCADQKYVRRINLTLFNAGSRLATFVVKIIKRGQYPALGEVVFNSTFGVPAETVQQFNSVYAPVPVATDYPWEWSLFFTITADQPFLSYVSTTFENPQPGAIPYEIFPSRVK